MIKSSVLSGRAKANAAQCLKKKGRLYTSYNYSCLIRRCNQSVISKYCGMYVRILREASFTFYRFFFYPKMRGSTRFFFSMTFWLISHLALYKWNLHGNHLPKHLNRQTIFHRYWNTITLTPYHQQENKDHLLMMLAHIVLIAKNLKLKNISHSIKGRCVRWQLFEEFWGHIWHIYSALKRSFWNCSNWPKCRQRKLRTLPKLAIKKRTRSKESFGPKLEN